MVISADKYKSDGNRAGPFLAVLQTVRGFVRWLSGLVILTDGDRTKAGIYFGGEGHDG
jgi:hypothetical protein